MKTQLSSTHADRWIRVLAAAIGILLTASIPMQAVFASQALASVSVGAQSGTLMYGAAASATYQVTVNCSGSGNTQNAVTVTLGISGLPAGVTSGFSPNPVTFAKNTCPTSQTSALTLSTTASSSADTTGFTVTGTANGGATQSGTGSLLIGRRPITVTAQHNTKAYDGTTSAAAIPSRTLGTLAPGDIPTYTETYDTASAGTGKTLTPSAVIVNGSSVNVTANYDISLVDDTTGVITKATPVLTVINSPVTYDGIVKSATVNASAPGAVSNVQTGGAATQTNAGTYPVTADFAPVDTANYESLSAASAGFFTINKATPSLTATSFSVTYNGLPHSTTAVSGSVEGTVTHILIGGAATQTNAGTYAITADFAPTDSTNYNSLSGAAASGSYIINKANAAVTVTPYSVTYNGLAHTASGTAFGVQSEILSGLLLNGTSHTAAGDYPGDAWTFTDSTGNYNDTSGTVHDGISKANASIAVPPYNVTYDGAAHSAAGTVTGALAEPLSGLVLTTTHTNAGDYPLDTWSFTDVTGNYNNASGFVHNSIAKANASVVVTPYSVTYDRTAHTATGTVTGVLSENLSGLAVTGTTHTNAGDYPSDAWAFTDVTGNYNNDNGTVHDVIAKTDASCTVNGYTGAYDGNAHGASGSCTGLGGEDPGTLDLGTSFTNAPGGTAHWALTGNANYKDSSADVSVAIAKAAALITVNGYTGIYDGSAHGATGTAVGVESAPANLNSLLHLGSSFTNVPGGTAHWTFDGNTNYIATSGDAAIVLGKAAANIVVTPYTVTYDGTVHTATGTAKGVLNETLAGLVLTATAHTNAGDHPTDGWTFADETGNYSDASGSIHDSIAKADAIIVVTPYSLTYDGAAHTAGGTATGVLTESLSGLDVTGTTHTNAGDYPADTWTFVDVTGNYNDHSASVHDVIGKATATVVLGDLSQTFNASPKPVSATTTPPGLTVNFTYDAGVTAPTNAGSYAVVGTVSDANYSGTDSDILVIGKADATCTVSGYTGAYDATAHGASGSCPGIGGETAGTLDLGSAFTNVPGGTASWSFTGNGNYKDQAGTAQITLSPVDAICTISGYSGAYDATAHGASGSCSGVGGADVSASLDLGETFTNVPGGTASWSFSGNPNYNVQEGTAPIALTAIDASCAITGYTGTYDVAAHGASGSCSGLNNEAVGTVSLGASFSNVPGGTAHWTLTGNDNYNDTSGDASIVIGKADASCTVNGYTGTYDATSHGASGSCSGVGEEAAGILELGASWTDVPGGPADWSLTGNGNYNNQSGSASIVINTATPTVHITGGTFPFDSLPHPAIANAAGVLSEAVTGSFVFHYNSVLTAPVAMGSYDVTADFTSANGNYGSASASCSACLVISAANQAPSFTSTAVTASSVGLLYTYNITTSDPESDPRTITAGTALPTWLTLTDHTDGTATLTGTPTLADMGSRVITLRVNDGHTAVDQVFTLNPSATLTLNSNKAYDGWVLESGELTAKGGSMNAIATTFNLGDDIAKRQYRTILSFKTSGVPVNAVISQITLKIKVSGRPVGANPFWSLGTIAVDIKKGTFGLPALQLTDFQQLVGVGGRAGAMSIKNTPVGGWYSATLTGSLANTLVNKIGTTQFRLRFSKDDNNNRLANYFRFFSGNALPANQPVLVIQYQLP